MSAGRGPRRRPRRRNCGRRPPGTGHGAPGQPQAVRAYAAALAARLDLALPPAVTVALVAACAQLLGLALFGVFGQFRRVVEARAFFGQAVLGLAPETGLPGTDTVLRRE